MQIIKKIVVLIILIQYLGLSAQNLVPNPSFETYTACPTVGGQLNTASPWYGTNADSDYYNSCASPPLNVPYAGLGFQYARTGSAFAGQWLFNGINYREYLQVALTSSLVANDCYLVKFYVCNQGAGLKYAIKNIAAHISMGGYSTNSVGSPATSFSPQVYLVNKPLIKDSLNWTEVGGIFTAVGGENYITIGNFKNDPNTDTVATNYGTFYGAYYYFDDVSIEKITTPQWSLKDTTIIGGDSVLIGPLYSGLTCNWFDMFGSPIGSGAGIWVKPPTTTSYVLQQTFCNNTFSDTVTVYVSAAGIKVHENKTLLKIYPNPVSNTLYISNKRNEFLNSEIEITNTLGQTVLKLPYKNEIDVSQLSSGYYSLKIITTEKYQFHSKFIKE